MSNFINFFRICFFILCFFNFYCFCGSITVNGIKHEYDKKCWKKGDVIIKDIELVYFMKDTISQYGIEGIDKIFGCQLQNIKSLIDIHNTKGNNNHFLDPCLNTSSSNSFHNYGVFNNLFPSDNFFKNFSEKKSTDIFIGTSTQNWINLFINFKFTEPIGHEFAQNIKTDDYSLQLFFSVGNTFRLITVYPRIGQTLESKIYGAKNSSWNTDISYHKLDTSQEIKDSLDIENNKNNIAYKKVLNCFNNDKSIVTKLIEAEEKDFETINKRINESRSYFIPTSNIKKFKSELILGNLSKNLLSCYEKLIFPILKNILNTDDDTLDNKIQSINNQISILDEQKEILNEKLNELKNNNNNVDDNQQNNNILNNNNVDNQ